MGIEQTSKGGSTKGGRGGRGGEVAKGHNVRFNLFDWSRFIFCDLIGQFLFFCDLIVRVLFYYIGYSYSR